VSRRYTGAEARALLEARALEAERDALRAKVDEARAAERASVVAWLRKQSRADASLTSSEAAAIVYVMLKIERGEHVAKGDR
jgi:hypothetical protein